MRLNDIFGNNDFLERVVNPSKRSDFLNALCFIWQRIRRLDIVSDRYPMATVPPVGLEPGISGLKGRCPNL